MLKCNQLLYFFLCSAGSNMRYIKVVTTLATYRTMQNRIEACERHRSGTLIVYHMSLSLSHQLQFFKTFIYS